MAHRRGAAQRLCIQALAGLLLLVSCVQQGRAQLSPAERIDELVTDLAEEGDFAGTVLVARRGEILVRKAYGLADVERGVPNTPESTYQLASVSKLFTRQLVLESIHRGDLGLEDTLDEWFPGFGSARQIRIRHLLNHTSGVADANNRDPRLSDPLLAGITRSREEMLGIFQEEELLFAPGTGVHYSSPGYSLLAYVLEDLYGVPFSSLLEERIFGPLHLSHTTFDEGPGVAIPYWEQAGELRPAPAIDAGHYIGVSSVHSSVDDLYLWYRAVYQERVLGEVARGAFALGSHYGHAWGSTTGFVPMPTLDIVVIVLSNLGHAPVQTVIPQIYTILLEPLIVPAERAVLDELAGDYRVAFLDQLEHVAHIRRRGDRLILRAALFEGAPETELILRPLGQDRFLMTLDGAFLAGTVTFERDPDGVLTGYLIENSGVAFRGLVWR